MRFKLTFFLDSSADPNEARDLVLDFADTFREEIKRVGLEAGYILEEVK